jgi:hypothetical protein
LTQLGESAFSHHWYRLAILPAYSLVLELRRRTASVLERATNCETAGQVSQLKGFTLGPFTHQRQLIFAQKKDYLLGLKYLSRYVATFDFPNRTLYLKNGKRFAVGDLQDKSGLHIVRLRAKPVVESVDKGSPAALVGVRPTDEIVRISDQDAKGLSLFSIRRLLCQPRQELRLAIRRGD